MFSVADFETRRRSRFGNPLYYFEQLDSTNETADQLARQGCPEGTVVLANEQIRGKGRKGNIWFSPADQNLYFSLVLRPESASLKYLPYMVCLSVQQALGRSGVDADFKWPNDVVVRDRKLCGILTQTSMEEQKLQFAIAGCGINVNVLEFPGELRSIATSVAMEAGAPQSREALLASVLLEFERLYEKIDTIGWEEFSAELERASTYLRGCPVRIVHDGEALEGTTAGLDGYGGLKVLTAAGEKTVYAGEVVSCRKK
ncbi:MAG TPA: biotin--[acetyl-CoA-carboxylase] ligase [Acidobacteriota bacterium]|nr:biotin--[acetyl-CoA-carboxylase] ligase [Acidobacteriota bacterium]